MNLIINSKDPKPLRSYLNNPVLFLLLFVFLALVVSGIGLFLDRPTPPAAPASPANPISVVDPLQTAITEVAISYGFPSIIAIRLSNYLVANDFNGLYGGVGPFSVRPSHLEWVKGSILQGTLVNLEDPLQNSQVALFLLSRFQSSGYDPITACLIYCFGFPAIHERGKYSGFLKFMGGDDLDD
jgi:hypothetical protein